MRRCPCGLRRTRRSRSGSRRGASTSSTSRCTRRSRRWPRTTASGRWRASIFTVDGEKEMGQRRITNEEVAELAAENADVADPVREHRPGARQDGRARGAAARSRTTASRASSSIRSTQGFFPNDRAAYAALRGDRRGADCPRCSTPGRPGIGAGHAGRRRDPAEVLEPDVSRRRRGRLPDHADRPRPPVVPVAGRGALRRDPQAAGLHRSLGLVAEVLSAAARAVREHAAQGTRCCSAPTIR